MVSAQNQEERHAMENSSVTNATPPSGYVPCERGCGNWTPPINGSSYGRVCYHCLGSQGCARLDWIPPKDSKENLNTAVSEPRGPTGSQGIPGPIGVVGTCDSSETQDSQAESTVPQSPQYVKCPHSLAKGQCPLCNPEMIPDPPPILALTTGYLFCVCGCNKLTTPAEIARNAGLRDVCRPFRSEITEEELFGR